MAVCVVSGGRQTVATACGEADVEQHVPASAETLFRVGSISKLVTAAAALRSAENGTIDLDAPVQRYVPAFPQKNKLLTTRLLLGHLGGIRHYGASDYLNRTRYASVTEALKAFQDSPLLSSPGDKYLYSSYGYNLVGAVLEAATGQDFTTLVRHLVLEPIGMRTTTVEEPEAIITGRSRGYSISGGVLQNGTYIDLTDRRPSGGFLSSALELARFGAAHLAPGFLTEKAHRQMFTSGRTSDGKETQVGLGWRIGRNGTETIWHHGGEAIGGRAFLLLRPERKLAIAILANLSMARFAETEAFAFSELATQA